MFKINSRNLLNFKVILGAIIFAVGVFAVLVCYFMVCKGEEHYPGTCHSHPAHH